MRTCWPRGPRRLRPSRSPRRPRSPAPQGCACTSLICRAPPAWPPRWVSEAPAALAGLQGSKGMIAPGYDADLVIVDPNQPTRVRPEIMRSRQRHSALDGMEFGFTVREVYLRGSLVAGEGGRRGRTGGRLLRPARRHS